MSPATTARNSALHWMQGNPTGRWPSPNEVAFLLKAPLQGGDSDPEQASGTSTEAYTYTHIPIPTRRHCPPLHQSPLNHTNSSHYSLEAGRSQYVEDHRIDALQYLERQKANVPNIGKRVKTKVRERAETIKDGIIEGQVGYALGKFAVEHDLANIPRLPEDALLGVAEDQYHSRDSYIAICNKALDHARQELKKGEMPIILAPSRDGEDNTADGPSRQTCPAAPSRPLTGGPDAYMHLLDDPPVLPQKFQSAPPALDAHKARLAERRQRANRQNSGSDTMYKDLTPDRYPTALRPGRESKGKRTVSWKLDPKPEPERQVKDDSTQYPGLSDTSPYRHPTALRPRAPSTYKEQSAPAPTRPDITRTNSGRPIKQLSHEIQRSWETADVLAPQTPTTPNMEMYRKLSRKSRQGWKQKKVRRDTTIVGSGELSAVNDAMARIKAMSEQPTEDIPTITMPAEAVARLKQMGKKPSEPVKTIQVGLNPQARTWEGQPQPDTRTIRRQPTAAALNPQAKTWEAKDKATASVRSQPTPQPSACAVPLNPQAKTWDNKPLPLLGVPAKRAPTNRPKPTHNPNAPAPTPNPAALNPQAKTWENKPLPQLGVPIKRAPKQPQPRPEAQPTTAAPLNPQAKTWDAQPLPTPSASIKRKPVAPQPQPQRQPQCQPHSATQASPNPAPPAPFASQLHQVNVARTLSQYHRQTRATPAPASGPVKFGDTHLEDPAVQHAERARERVVRRRPARYRQRTGEGEGLLVE